MPVVRRGDVDGIEIVASQQLPEVDIGGTVAVAIVAVGPPLAFLPPFPPHVADGDILHIAPAEKGTLVAAAHVSDPDAPHHDPIAGWRSCSVA